MTRDQLVNAAILLRESELHDLGMLLDDGSSLARIQRLADRDPLVWTMRLIELHQLVHLARCMSLLSIVAGIVPEELQRDIEANRPPL